MAWNTERTKELLLAAATEEFSANGLAGARVDRIAAAAGVNKERIYQYFGKKDELFDAVLAAEMIRVMTEVPIQGHGPEAFGDYAGRLFDRHTTDGVLPRLVFWEGLERGRETVSRATRTDHCAIKVGQVMEVLPGVGRRRRSRPADHRGHPLRRVAGPAPDRRAPGGQRPGPGRPPSGVHRADRHADGRRPAHGSPAGEAARPGA